MGRITGLHHLCIFTKNMEESIRFYRDNLGFEVVYTTIEGADKEPDGFVPVKYALIRLGNCSIEVLEPSDVTRVKVGLKGIIDHIGLAVENIEEVVEGLNAKGVKTNMNIATNTTLMNGFKATTITGPSGEAIGLYEFF